MVHSQVVSVSVRKTKAFLLNISFCKVDLTWNIYPLKLKHIRYRRNDKYFIVLHSTEWRLEENGFLRNTRTGYCVRPVSGNAVAGAGLEITSASASCHQFTFTQKGSLQHKSQRLCVQTAKKVMSKHSFFPCWAGTTVHSKMLAFNSFEGDFRWKADLKTLQ